MTFAQIIATPISTQAGALAFLQGLVDADRTYHLEDGPHTIVDFTTDKPVFTREEADQVEQRVAECYGLDCWTQSDCPIGRMMRFYVVRPLVETTTEALSERFLEWRQWEGFGDVEGDAMELLRFAETTQPQRDWLATFCDYWDAVQKAEDAARVGA